MNRQIKDELYYEEYDNVAIMFATITNYNDIQSDATVDIERNILSILNRIICDFDGKLLSKTGPLKLEKIKVSGWTYMVACGLDPGRSDSSASLNSGCNSPNQRTSLLSNGRRSWNTFNFSKSNRHFFFFFFEKIIPIIKIYDITHTQRQSQKVQRKIQNTIHRSVNGNKAADNHRMWFTY